MTQVLMLVVGLLAGAGIGYFVRKALIEARTGAVEVRAREIMAEAERDAMAAKSQALVEAKDEATRIRQEAEAEAKALLFPGSPTIRIEGKDVEPNEASAPGLACRLYSNLTGVPSEQALRLAEERLASSETLRAAVGALADDPAFRVRFQLAFTLGESDAPETIGKLAP